MRAYGAWPAGLLLAFTVLTALSIVWSVQPDHSWQDAGRMLAYTGVFAAGVALVRVVPDRWPAVLGGLTLAAVVVCAYALVTKVFPSLDPLNTFARLNEPYRLLERGRADGRDGRDQLLVARLAAHRPRAAAGARLSGDGRAAADARARLLARRARGARAGAAAVVLRGAAAPARARRF